MPVHRMRQTARRDQADSESFAYTTRLPGALSGLTLKQPSSPVASPTHTASHALTFTRRRLQDEARQQRVEAVIDEDMQATLGRTVELGRTAMRSTQRRGSGSEEGAPLLRSTTPVISVTELQLGTIVRSCSSCACSTTYAVCARTVRSRSTSLCASAHYLRGFLAPWSSCAAS